MAGNTNLSAAKDAKNDEFYTQYSDIESEMNAYVEFNPDVFRGKQFFFRAMTRSGRTSQSISQRTSNGSA